MSKTRCNLFYCVVWIIICYGMDNMCGMDNYVLIIIHFAVNNDYVLKITDILMSIILSIIKTCGF